MIRFPVDGILRFMYRPKITIENNVSETEPIILACNDKNRFDSILLLISKKRADLFLAKDKLHKELIAPFFRWIDTIHINRNTNEENVINMVIEALKKGKLIAIFQEGTHNKTKDIIMPIKDGAESIAKKTEELIAPCTIIANYKMFRKGLMIIIGNPFSLDNMESGVANKLLESKLIELLEGEKKSKLRTAYLC